jgi:hypothetical protein
MQDPSPVRDLIPASLYSRVVVLAPLYFLPARLPLITRVIRKPVTRSSKRFIATLPHCCTATLPD